MMRGSWQSIISSSSASSSHRRRLVWGFAETNGSFPAPHPAAATTRTTTIRRKHQHHRLFFPCLLDRPPTDSLSMTSRISSTSLDHTIPIARNFSSVLSRGGSTSGNSTEEPDITFEISSHHDKFSTTMKPLPSPHQALSILEGQTDQGTLSLEEKRRLFQVVTTSGVFRLLEQATRHFFDALEDPECLHLLVTGWARHVPPMTITSGNMAGSNSSRTIASGGSRAGRSTATKQSTSRRSNEAVSGAVVAAQLLKEWWRRSKNHSLHQPPMHSAFRAVLGALADEERYVLAGKLFQLILDNSNNSSIVPDRDCFHRVLLACSKAGAVDEGRLWLERMTELGCTDKNLLPTVSTYKILLQTYVNQGTPGLGLAAYQLLKEMPVKPDHICYNITLNALAEEGNYELAQELFEQLLLEQTNISSDTEGNDKLPTVANIDSGAEEIGKFLRDPIPLRTVLKACARAGTVEAAERAEALLTNLPLSHVPCLDARAYTTVVAIWCQRGHPERAQSVLDDLLTLYLESSSDPRLQPDPMCFRTVVGAYSQKINRIMSSSDANLKYHQMNRHSTISSSSLTEQAVELAERAQQVLTDSYHTMGYTPNLVTCNTILNCWSQARQPEAAEDFLQLMLQWNISPDIVSYNTIIACHAKLGKVSNCTTWLHKLSSTASPSNSTSQPSSSLPTPNTRTVTSVITALSKQGTIPAAEQAEAWFLLMQDWHAEHGWDCAPNQVTWNALLTCWARVGNGPRAEYLLREFQHSCHQQKHQGGEDSTDPPNIVSYNAVLQSYTNGNNNSGNSHNLKKVEAFLEELIAIGLQPNDRTVQLAQRALSLDSGRSIPEENKTKWAEWEQRYFYFTCLSQKNNSNNKARRQPHNQQESSNKNNKVLPAGDVAMEGRQSSSMRTGTGSSR